MAEEAIAMAKTIMQLVAEKNNRLKAAPNDPAIFAEAEENAKLASRAIAEGHLSVAWRQYMLQFVEQAPLNTRQLARLLAADDTLGVEMMDRRRAYLLGNAVCGGGSTGQLMLGFGVDGIDDGL